MTLLSLWNTVKHFWDKPFIDFYFYLINILYFLQQHLNIGELVIGYLISKLFIYMHGRMH